MGGDLADEVEVLLDPVADHRQARAEPARHDVLGVADEQRAVAHGREARNLLEHLLVEVGGQERLALAALGQRQPAHEVGQEHERRALVLGVLVQEVIDVPRLVADPEVVGLLSGEVAEDHVVGQQDLVHLADRLEDRERVLARCALNVPGLRRQRGARRVHPLPGRLERGRQRVLGEPIDREPGDERAELARDRDVAPRVAEADRRGHQEGPPAAPRRPRPAPLRRGRGTEHARGEIVDQRVDPYGVARGRDLARSLEHHQLPTGQLGDAPAPLERRDAVEVAVDRQDRAAHGGHERLGLLARLVARRRVHRAFEHRAPGVEAPAHAVLDLLLGMGLLEDLAEEELDEAREVPLPGAAGEARPALVDAGVLVEVLLAARGARARAPARSSRLR